MVSLPSLPDFGKLRDIEYLKALLVQAWKPLAVALAGFVIVSLAGFYLTDLTRFGLPWTVITLENGACRCTILLRCSCSAAMNVIVSYTNLAKDLAVWYGTGIVLIVAGRSLYGRVRERF